MNTAITQLLVYGSDWSC